MISYCTFKVNYWNRIADDKNNKMTYKERKKQRMLFMMMAHGLRKIDFKRVLKVSVEGDDLIIHGKLFHSSGSETADVLSPLGEKESSDCSADVRGQEVE